MQRVANARNRVEQAGSRTPRPGKRPPARGLRRPATAGQGFGDIDLGPLRDWIGFNLRMAQASAFHAFARRTQEFDIQPGRFAVLVLIGRNPGISQTALSRATGRDKSTLTPALADLGRRRLIVRRRVAEDRRSYRLFLTPAGEAMLAKLTQRAALHEEQLERLVGKADRDRFMDILRRLISDLA
ncbi:MAG: MarR family winged helix-turn-helix transcriptional regulator [Hyphomicrobiaceae bacterium]|nr:MarR family winged helix-turn-helix transcriptional regulator [Hyphomicrobiaceae bacterium]